jgi:DNA repair protein RecN (Recombination protein N)
MLHQLRIRNFAIVDRLEIDCADGLSVFTGETGAGKSIVVEAIRFLLGGRASLDMIRTGTTVAVVEGLFDLPQDVGAKQTDTKSNGDEPIWIRRELPLKGAGRCFIGDRQIPRNALQTLAEHLGDLCGQHQQQILLDPQRHTEFLDTVVGNGELVDKVADAWEKLSENIAATTELTAALEHRQEHRELLDFQIREIRAANIKPDEDEKLKAEALVLKNARRLAETAEQTLTELSEADNAIGPRIATLLRNARKMAEMDARWNTVVEQLALAQESTEELSRHLGDYRQQLDFDPARLDAVESRLSELFRLKAKYGESCAAILEHLAKLENEHHANGREDEHLATLSKQRVGLEQTLAAHAEQLTQTRREAVKGLETRLNVLVGKLGMPEAKIKIETRAFTDGGLDVATDDGPMHVRKTGAEFVRFTFEANPKEGFKPLDKIASGGELSRLLLAFKSIEISRRNPERKRGNGDKKRNGDHIAPLFVFDEVDSGIGGAVAYAVAKQIKTLAQNAQVFLITHLQQMAAAADSHYLIAKQTTDGRARVTVERLDDDARVRELARMVAGDEITASTLEVAAELANAKKS